ncbi:MAG: hypothetical protein AseanaTS_18550 [Candidatus Pelagadaptatus aseana]|uniref:efflux RND transporter periplasmic adaptor subunit n=1 Tax=Candidatus Pelagadaptatus aseana TaxID=3120508 RepID=UPI0039B25DA7
MAIESITHSASTEPVSGDIKSPAITLDYLNQCAEQGSWYQVWLDYTLRDLSGIASALLAVDDDQSQRLKPVAASIAGSQDSELLGYLIEESAYCEDPVVMPLDDGQGAYGIAYPVVINHQIKSVFACRIKLSSASDIETFMARLEWLCFWIESHFLKLAEASHLTKLDHQKTVLDGYLSIFRAENWQESALQWADTLANRFQCERVSIGYVRRHQVKLAVISGSSENDLRSVSAKKIRLAMQEAFDQKSLVVWPPTEARSGSHQVSHNTEKLSSSHHNTGLLCVPLSKDDAIYAMVLLERHAEQPFNDEEVGFIESAAALVGLGLEEKIQGQQSLLRHLQKSVVKQLHKFVTPGQLKRKLFVTGALLLVAFFSLVEGHYTVNADVALEPRQIRIVSAPFNGYLKQALVRAGDKVTAGAELASLEDRDLRLEKIKWLSQIEQDKKQYTESLADYDRSQAQILFAKMAQSRAQLAVTNSHLERSVIKAPFDALIVSGDLSKRVGGSINQGEEMFQISPMNAYRLILYVSEYKIRDVELGQTGQVVLSSLPHKNFDFLVEKITPITEVREGGTFFRVEADIKTSDPAFRPGLVGIAKIDVEDRLLIDNWTHDLRKWLAMKLWSFWG